MKRHRITVGWSVPSRPVAVLFVVVVMAAGPCNSGTRSAAERTEVTIHEVFKGVARFRDSLGSLPPTIEDVCRANAWWCQLDSLRWPVDGWSRRVSYRADGEQYEVRSSGADGILNTPDDVVLSSSQERGLVQQLAGCYDFLPVLLQLNVSGVILDTAHSSAAQYRLRPVGTWREAHWYPVPNQQVWLEWSTPPSGLLVQVTVHGDSVEGTIEEGSDFGAGRRRRVIGHRVACAQ